MQEKMFKVVQREIDEMSEGEKWKVEDEENPPEDEDRTTW